MLLAHRGAMLVGCLYATQVAPRQAFSQGLRVHPDYRRAGVATLLANEQQRRLRVRGHLVVRGVTSVRNHRARAFFQSTGWTEIGTFHRRRLPDWTATGPGIARGAPPPASLLASREGRAHFRRIYFSATASWLLQAQQQGRWHARDGAHVLLDPPDADCGTWVAALGGPAAALGALLREFSPPWREPRGLTVESPAAPAMQRLLDDLGFRPPDPDGSYVVVERPL